MYRKETGEERRERKCRVDNRLVEPYAVYTKGVREPHPPVLRVGVGAVAQKNLAHALRARLRAQGTRNLRYASL